MSFDEIVAPLDWHCVDFISDLHLQENEPANFLAWRKYLEKSPADAIFILGDLFEVWVGDDVISSGSVTSKASLDTSHSNVASNLTARHEGLHFEDRCSRVLHHCAQQRHVYFLQGNRDFLVGKSFAQACGLQMLSDPSVLEFAGQRYLLSHGDALCLADKPYQQFRATVRSPQWQEAFLATPLQERIQQARMMRQASESRKKEYVAAGQPWIDIDPQAARQWMDESRCQHFIHGHTHEGRDHAITTAQGRGTRYVLPDWHVNQHPARGSVLRLARSKNEGEDHSANSVSAQHIPVA